MRDFKVGDYVYVDSPDWYSGIIVAIEGDIADVEYDTGGGGGTIPCQLEKLYHAADFSNEISRMCYELYKVHWEASHMIDMVDRANFIKDYYSCLAEEGFSEAYYPYERFLADYGYNGDIYVSFSEFCRSEYRNADYIHSLLGKDNLIAMYNDDIGRR